MALRRRAIAVHHAKVPKSHPDNGSDIRKMLKKAVQGSTWKGIR